MSAIAAAVFWAKGVRYPVVRDVLRFSAAETGEPNLGHIADNQRGQWALHQSPHVRGVTELRAGLEALDFDEGAARLTLSDGRRYTCALVVGADGGKSRVRELCGIGRAGWNYGQTAVVAHLRPEQPHRGTAYQRFLPDGPLAFLPLRDGRVHWCGPPRLTRLPRCRGWNPRSSAAA